MGKQVSNLKRSGYYAIAIVQTAIGAVMLAASGLTMLGLFLSGMIFIANTVPFTICAALFILAVVLLIRGSKNRKALNLSSRLISMFSGTDRVSVKYVAEKTGYSEQEILDYVEFLTERDWISDINVTKDGRELVYFEGVFTEPEKKTAAEDNTGTDLKKDGDNTLLEDYIKELTELDWKITDEKMAKSVHEILSVNRAILDYIKKNPEKHGQLRRLTGYYLPTTLKLIKSYDNMSRQAPKGENIKESMRGIEGIIDNVADTFRREYDNLYKDAAIDISSDIEVLRAMMNLHGLDKL